MSGSVPFEKALAARLALFNPSLSQLQEFLEKRPPRYTICFISCLQNVNIRLIAFMHNFYNY